jgi:hypothetical protein
MFCLPNRYLGTELFLPTTIFNNQTILLSDLILFAINLIAYFVIKVEYYRILIFLI